MEQLLFKKSILNKSNGVNLKKLKLNNFHAHETKRQALIDHFQKWDLFRLRRDKIIDQYIDARKVQEIAQIFLKQCCLNQILQTLFAKFKE